MLVAIEFEYSEGVPQYWEITEDVSVTLESQVLQFWVEGKPVGLMDSVYSYYIYDFVKPASPPIVISGDDWISKSEEAMSS